MNTSRFSNEVQKESFGLILISIALSACYLLITRCSLILTFWKISLTLDDESQVKGYFVISLISFAVTVLLSLWFLFSFFTRKLIAKYIFLTLVIMYLLVTAASYIYGEFVVGLDVDSLTPGYINHLLVDTIIFLFIFTPYIFFSNKSKKVFVIK